MFYGSPAMSVVCYQNLAMQISENEKTISEWATERKKIAANNEVWKTLERICLHRLKTQTSSFCNNFVSSKSNSSQL